MKASTRVRVASTSGAAVALVGAVMAVFWGAVPSVFWVAMLGAGIAFGGAVIAHAAYRRSKKVMRDAETNYQRTRPAAEEK